MKNFFRMLFVFTLLISISQLTLHVSATNTSTTSDTNITQGNEVPVVSISETSIPSTPTISVEETSPNSGEYTISCSGVSITKDEQSLRYAVWSLENGQDDVKWYNTTYNTSTDTWDAKINISNHKNIGIYKVHAYKVENNSLTYLKGTSFSIDNSTIQTVDVTTDNKSGDFTVCISDITAPAGIQKIKVAVWSTANRSNLIWYSATKQADNTYSFSSNINKHKNMTGTYKLHVYLEDSLGNLQYQKYAPMTFSPLDTVLDVSFDKTASDFNIHLTGSFGAENSTKITYAVWSATNAQDDLKWYTGSSNCYGSNSATIDMSNHKNYGTYYVHAYEHYSDGSSKYLKATSFQVAPPTIGNISTTTTASTGEFTITIDDIISQTGIANVKVAVWSTSNRSNLQWYTATKQDNGSYTISSSITKHQYLPGTYKIHVYTTDKTGSTNYGKASTMVVDALPLSLKASDTTGTESLFTLNLTGSAVHGNGSYITYAVWSLKDGQDDLKWYKGRTNDYANDTATVPISNHKELGTYNVYAYKVNLDGSKLYLCSTSFTVDNIPSMKINTSADNTINGTFSVTLDNIIAPAGISSISVPVWTQSDHSDIHYYTASKIDNDTYKITVDVANHNYNFGTFKIHTYTTMKNGIKVYSGASSHYFNINNFLDVTKTTDKYRTVTLANVSPSATKVSFPTWSNTSEQDDITWYTAKKQSNGTWTATIKTANFAHYGTAYTHAYVDNTYVKSASYYIDQNEVGKNGWYYEGGYKLYYINGKLQTNLDGILAKQSRYYIRVNRTLCTVTVYAKDGNKGYIIPVRVFACSVGLPHTPTPVGTFTTSNKYRWHTLMGPSYGQYCTRITGGILFHSVAGYNTTSYNISASAYNKLGSPASHGCVRLTVADAKWIYDNCVSGTTVNIFNSNSAGPFPKPATIKIPPSQNWDPTDPAVKK